jgi:hypothetical protein
MGWGGGGEEVDGQKIIKMGMASPKELGDEYGIFLNSNILISI